MSYLSIAARMGAIGLALLAVVLVLLARDVVRLARCRRLLGERAVYADVTLALLAAFFAGALTEGILLATLTFWLLVLYFAGSLLAFLVDAYEQATAPAQTHDFQGAAPQAPGVV